MTCPSCDGLGCSDCSDAPAPHPALVAYWEAWRTVADDSIGAEVVAVYCAACRDRRKLASVRRHPRFGLYFDALLPGGVGRNDQMRAREAKLKAATGDRVTAAQGRSLVLLDFPEQIPTYAALRGFTRLDSPGVECPYHGPGQLDRALLRDRARRWHPGEPVSVVTIHQPE